MAITVETVANRDIVLKTETINDIPVDTTITTNRMVLARKSYFPYWDGQGEPPNGNVNTIGGVTSMTWYVYEKGEQCMVNKTLIVEGKNVQDNEVKSELIAAGWILAEDNVIIT